MAIELYQKIIDLPLVMTCHLDVTAVTAISMLMSIALYGRRQLNLTTTAIDGRLWRHETIARKAMNLLRL
jgi:hypothetical protein